jgi:hypothetical protein
MMRTSCVPVFSELSKVKINAGMFQKQANGILQVTNLDLWTLVRRTSDSSLVIVEYVAGCDKIPLIYSYLRESDR